MGNFQIQLKLPFPLVSNSLHSPVIRNDTGIHTDSDMPRALSCESVLSLGAIATQMSLCTFMITAHLNVAASEGNRTRNLALSCRLQQPLSHHDEHPFELGSLRLFRWHISHKGPNGYTMPVNLNSWTRVLCSVVFNKYEHTELCIQKPLGDKTLKTWHQDTNTCAVNAIY